MDRKLFYDMGYLLELYDITPSGASWAAKSKCQNLVNSCFHKFREFQGVGPSRNEF